MTSTNPVCTARRHGTRSAVERHHCRCPDALTARRADRNRQYHNTRTGAKERSMDATGACRRVQALAAIGWTQQDVAKLMGYARKGLPFMTGGHAGRIMVSTHASVDRVYRELRDTDGGSAKTRERARQQGWPTPGEWDRVDIDDPDQHPADSAGGAEVAALSDGRQWRRPTRADYTDDGRLVICRTHTNPDLWYGEETSETLAAARLCATCPVMRDCLRTALVRDERWGVWGGLSQEARNRLRARLIATIIDRTPGITWEQPPPLEGTPELEDAVQLYTKTAPGPDPAATTPAPATRVGAAA